MSNYVERVLQPGEQVRHVATIHWITYVPGFAVLVVSLGVLYAAGLSLPGGEKIWQILSAALAVFAIILIFRAWFHRWITEIAVTDRRVIYKTGFISRKTNEMHMDKVESVEVNQSILGRIFDYGDVTMVGTGDSRFNEIKTVASPIDLRNQITGR
jgi:uncharacterized membrane protein YdbT with pleckstrin-like domain